MCLSKLLSGYEITLISLKKAIEDDDSKRIKMLDHVVSAEFEAILEYQPDTADELRQLAEFLLTQLNSENDRSEVQSAIVEKLTSLFSHAFR